MFNVSKAADKFCQTVNEACEKNTSRLYTKMGGNGQVRLTYAGLLAYEDKIKTYMDKQNATLHKHKANCPNCGAPLPMDGHCEYCGSIIPTTNNYQTIKDTLTPLPPEPPPLIEEDKFEFSLDDFIGISGIALLVLLFYIMPLICR